MPLELRAFGAFEGTVSNEQALKPLLLDAVRAAVTQHPKGAVGALREKDAVAAAAQAHLAPRLHLVGAAGQLTIAMISMSEEDAAQVRTASVNAAARAHRIAIAPAAP